MVQKASMEYFSALKNSTSGNSSLLKGGNNPAAIITGSELPAKCSERAIDVGSPLQPLSFASPLALSYSSHTTKDSHLQAGNMPTPGSTPTTARKTKRRSNIFPNLSTKHKNLEEKNKNGELGSGRAIPIRQGYLYKKSQKALNKEWKKKYVTLTTDGKLTYHPTLHDYMDDVHGKSIPLKHTTVKVPGGLKFKVSKASSANGGEKHLPPNDLNSLTLGSTNGGTSSASSSATSSRKLIPSTNPLLLSKEKSSGSSSPFSSSSVKKRHRRHKSITGKDAPSDDPEDACYEFVVVSLENKQWQFEAESVPEREAWVTAVELQILNSLQGLESDKTRFNASHAADKATVQAIRTAAGNLRCADCDTISEWI